MKYQKSYNRIMVLLLVMSGGAILHNLYSSILSTISYILLLIGFLLNIRYISKKELSITLLSFLILFIYLFLNFIFAPLPNNINEYLKFQFKLVYLFLFVFYYFKLNLSLKDDLFIILKYLMILSIIGIFLANLIPFVFSPINDPSIISRTFLYIFYSESSFIFKGITFYRNQGIFWEPGAFQFFLNLLLFILLSEQKDKKLIALTIFAILSTNSTTGLFILVSQLAYFYFKNIHITSTHLFLRLPIIILIVIIPLFLFLKTNVTQKTEGEHKLSSTLRVYDTKMCINLIKEYPVMGIGLNKNNYIKLQTRYNEYHSLNSLGFSYIIDERGNTNSLLYYIAMFGIPLFLVFFYFLYYQNIIHYNRKLFLFILIISSLSEPQLTTTFFMLFPISGFFYKLKK